MSLSIIVPMLDEEAGIEAVLQALRPLGAEIVVVDGGSTDRSVAFAEPLSDRVIVAPRGRARQMNAGAAIASGDILLFLHADTVLPAGAGQLMLDAIESGAHWGRFDVRIEGASSFFPLIATLMNLRSRLTGIATGDQAIFVTSAAFRQVGGFPDQALMEDIVLSRRLCRIGRPACLQPPVVTAGRRWVKQGVVRTILHMWWLRLRFFLGAKPNELAREYGYQPHDT